MELKLYSFSLLFLRNDDDFQLPAPRIDFFKKMPLYALPLEWNNSGLIKFYENQVTFRHKLKEMMFEELTIDNRPT
jgi:hypothetical protein